MLEKNLLREAFAQRRCYWRSGALQVAAALCTVAAAAALAALAQRVFWGRTAWDEAALPMTVLFFAWLARTALLWLARAAAEKVALEVADAMRSRLLQGIGARGPIALAGEKRGELAACLTEGIEQTEPFFTEFLPRCTAVAAALPVFWAAAFWVDFWTGLIFLVTAPLLPLFLFLIGSRVARAGKRQWEALTAAGAQFLDLLEGLATLRLFGQASAQKKAVEATGASFARASLNVLRVAFLSAFALELAATLSIAFVAVSVALRLLAGRMLFADAFYLLLLAPELYQPLRRLGAGFHSAVLGSAAAARIYGFFSAPQGAEGADVLAMRRPVALRFEAVQFRYEEGRGNALDGFELAVGAGRRIAVLGLSGAGKSTLFRLLLQFARPDAGEIYLNERPLSSLAPEAARRCFVYLPQSPHIFAASVAQNIALAKADATKEEIIRAAREACAHDWICTLPEGYETLLGAGGRALSGGQAQRIALARAFLCDAPVLLLDEPAAGLDIEARETLEKAVARLGRGRTVLEITHCLRAAREADEIAVVQDGKVAEHGAHAELLARRGVYASLWAAQRRWGA